MVQRTTMALALSGKISSKFCLTLEHIHAPILQSLLCNSSLTKVASSPDPSPESLASCPCSVRGSGAAEALGLPPRLPARVRRRGGRRRALRLRAQRLQPLRLLRGAARCVASPVGSRAIRKITRAGQSLGFLAADGKNHGGLRIGLCRS